MSRRSRDTRQSRGGRGIRQLPWREIVNGYPWVEELSADQVEAIHEASMNLLERQGMRTLHSKKSRYYEAALRNFAAARRCYERAGQAGEWHRLVEQVRAEHRRKTGFMPDFEALVGGVGPERKPSFLDRCKGPLADQRCLTPLIGVAATSFRSISCTF